MRFISIITKAASALVIGLALSSAASAQATRTWVSGVGDDANPCSRTAPCKTFAGAISKTATGGEINVLDPGGFGGVTITKSITIDGGGFIASALVSGTNAIVINATATSNIVLRNIQLQGLGTGLNGINFLAGKSLLLDNVIIQAFVSGTAGSGNGVKFVPSAASGATTLTIQNSRITHNGGNATAAAIFVKPVSPATATVVINNVVATQNTQAGFRAEDNTFASITNSVFSNNVGNGIQAFSTSLPVRVNTDFVTSSNNGGAGIRADGANGRVVISNTAAFRNGTGLSVATSGQILSFQNNRVEGNGTDGAPSGTVNQM